MHLKNGDREKMEKFSLKLNAFHGNVSKSFQNLKNKEHFSDVTLVGDDFKPIAAHRVILSSCSIYFNNILKNIANDKKPTLCLEGMSFEDIEKVMDYIYHENHDIAIAMSPSRADPVLPWLGVFKYLNQCH